MKPNDWIDEILYHDLELLDHAMLDCLEKEKEDEYQFSDQFEKKMWFLKEELRSGKLRKRKAKMYFIRRISVKKIYVAALVSMMTLLLTLTAVAAGIKIIRYSQYHDSLQGADIYNYHVEYNGEESDIIKIYPNYIPDAYRETVCDYNDTFHELIIDYEDDEGNTIYYSMKQMTDNCSTGMTFDAEYDSSETLEINGLEWFCTYRKGSYRMARVWKDDLFLYLSSPDTLPEDEFKKILEGIVPPERPRIRALEEKAEE